MPLPLDPIVADLALLRSPSRHLLVGIDGVDGSGKTTFAKLLGERLETIKPVLAVQIVHLDDFHHPRQIRYRLGTHSPQGFFEDSYDLNTFRRLTLTPLTESAGGATSIVLASYDTDTEQPVTPPVTTVAAGSVILVEGMFLHRDELAQVFDYTVFLDVPFDVSAQRLHERDGSNPDPNHPSLQRYVGGQQIYLNTCRPHLRANRVIPNV